MTAGYGAQFRSLADVRGLCLFALVFVRFGHVSALWRWTGWHYRFRWLVTAFGCSSFRLWPFSLCRVWRCSWWRKSFFGGAIGLIYYSSLFYSMDAGDTKGEHGGIHEAAIGVGNCIGPAVGAVTLQFLPGLPTAAPLP